MAESKLFFDSSAWLGYFIGNLKEPKNLVDSPKTVILTSLLSVHEIIKKLRRLGKTGKETSEALGFIENNSIIVNLNKEIMLNSIDCSFEYGLHAIDSMIYSSAIALGAVLVTADSDFKNAPRTMILG